LYVHLCLLLNKYLRTYLISVFVTAIFLAGTNSLLSPTVKNKGGDLTDVDN